MSLKQIKQYGVLTNHILNLLANEYTLHFVRDKHERRLIHEESDKIWLSIDRKQLYRVLDKLKLKGYIKSKNIKNGEILMLNNKGMSMAIVAEFKNIKIKKIPKKWDKKWRIVMFDVPESKKKIRDSLRNKLRNIGFIEFQKSVFVHPYPCRNEINFIINYFDASKYVYYVDADIFPDNKLRSHFRL